MFHNKKSQSHKDTSHTLVFLLVTCDMSLVTTSIMSIIHEVGSFCKGKRVIEAVIIPVAGW